jgi:transposase-like protein
MLIALHKQARTTPAVRAEIAASTESVAALARRYNVAEVTVRKWRSRTEFHDRSHTAHRLQTRLDTAQEVIVVHLRRSLLLPLDDLLAVTREFLCPSVSRSGLDRCLRRHGVGNLKDLLPASEKAVRKPFKAYPPGYLHMDIKYLPQMADEAARRYLFVAIDRATRWVYVAINQQDGGFRQGVPEGAAQGLPDQDHQAPDRQRQGVHRSPVRLQGPPTDGGARVRPVVRCPRHRAPPDPAQDSADQRHGGTLQWPYQRHPEDPPLRIGGRPGADPASLRVSVQPSTSTVGPRE